jgi:hypothetical protein
MAGFDIVRPGQLRIFAVLSAWIGALALGAAIEWVANLIEKR